MRFIIIWYSYTDNLWIKEGLLMKTPLSMQKVRNYLTYSSWKYILLLLLAIFGWNLVFTMTRYRPPEEKKVVINMYVDGSQEALNTYMAGVNETLLPEMEE